MRMIKVFCASVLCSLLFAFGTQAATEDIYDLAGLLTADEISTLSAQMDEIADTYKTNVVLLTTNDAEGKDTQEYADDFYMDYGYYESAKKGGIILAIDMDNRRVQIETEGDMRYCINDSEIDEIIDAGYDDVANGDYGSCFANMLTNAEAVMEEGISSGDYLIDENGNHIAYKSITPFEGALAGILALVAGIVPCGIVVGKYKLHLDKYKYTWRTNSKIEQISQQDQFINQTVMRRHIPKDPPPSSRGGGGGGGSSIHTSSGGGSFGGGGRNF